MIRIKGSLEPFNLIGFKSILLWKIILLKLRRIMESFPLILLKIDKFSPILTKSMYKLKTHPTLIELFPDSFNLLINLINRERQVK